MRSVRAGARFLGVLTVACASSALPGHLVGQHLPPVLTALQGQWAGVGELFGRAASFSMRWENPSDGVVTLSFSNGMVGDDGAVTPVLEATAIYRSGRDSIRGVWLDSRNERVELSATATPSSLVTTWQSRSERGRTEYRVQPDGTVVVEDHVQTEDGWRPFGTARYERVTPLPPPGPA